MNASARPVTMEKIANLCKRRGFVYQSSEIYGGLASCWDYGPLGVELKRNITEAWWRDNITSREDMVGLDSSILMHPKVWEASGHIEGFTDPLVDCKSCKQRFRADQLAGDRCPECGGELTEARQFNLMFRTFMGPVEDTASTVYLRPETAQGIFVNFQNVLNASRLKLPFGIGQIGKSFRNEITPGNFLFRTREFEQMEMEFFVQARRRPALARVLESRALRLVPALRHSTRAPAPAGARRRRARALRQGLRRRRVRVPVRLVGARRASRTAPTST